MARSLPLSVIRAMAAGAVEALDEKQSEELAAWIAEYATGEADEYVEIALEHAFRA